MKGKILLSPSPKDTIDRERNDLRKGLQICIIDDAKCWLIFSIETLDFSPPDIALSPAFLMLQFLI